MNKKNLWALVVALICSTAMFADTFTDSYGVVYSYSTSGDTASVIEESAQSASGDVILPYYINTGGKSYKVTCIENYAFRNCAGITSISIPYTVTTIGTGAFTYCSNLRSVQIPSSLKRLGRSIFWECDNLTSIVVVVNSGTKYYDSRNNCNCIIETASNTIVAGCKNSTIPNTVTSIGEDAFIRCKGLTSITIPNSVTSIGESAFYYCENLTSITIPNSVTRIEGDTFRGCERLTSVTIPNSVESIESRAFEGCTKLASIDIPNSMTTIGNFAFYNCKELTSVKIPKSVTSIGVGAFASCEGLASITVDKDNPNYNSRNNCNCIIETESNTLVAGCMNSVIPNTITAIGNYAFEGCQGLTSVVIPKTVTSLGSNAFDFCDNITDITYLTETPSKINASGYNGTVFSETCVGTATLHVLKILVPLYQLLDGWKNFRHIEGVVDFTTKMDTNDDGNVNSADVVAIYGYIINGADDK